MFCTFAVSAEEAVQSRDFQRVHPDGSTRAARRPTGVPSCAGEACQPGALRQTCTELRVREGTSAAATSSIADASPADVRGGCNRCRGTVDQEDMGAISGEVERLLPRVGSLENPGERESGGSSRDVGALERGEAHAGLPRVEGEQSNELSSMLVQCPGCASVLKHNAGASPYLLSCDGAEHAGSKDIRMCERFSCLVCGRFVHALWSLYACLYLHVTHANVAFMSDDREVVRTIMQLF